MWWINWAREQEWEDWVVVRKMSDLPNRWLKIIDTWTKFYKNELWEILTIDPKMEELYSYYFALWDYKEALSICISMILEEVKKEILRGSQRWVNLKTWAYEVTFDNISTPTALKWKQRISELTR